MKVAIVGLLLIGAITANKPPLPDVRRDAPPLPDARRDAPPLPDARRDAPPLPDTRRDAPPLPDARRDAPPLPDARRDAPPLPDARRDAPPLPDARRDAPPLPDTRQELPVKFPLPEERRDVPVRFPDASNKLKDCYTGDGTSYTGNKSTSKSGKTCLIWKSVYDFLDADHNYCRNFFPNLGIKEPVCYINANNNIYEPCGIKKCGE